MVQSIEKSWCIDIKSYIQWIATFGVFMLMVEVGIEIGWASPNLARLTEEDSDIPLTAAEASWLASLVGLGGAIGAFVGSISIAFIGSRRTIVLIFVLFSISWLGIISANSAEWLYTCRLLVGLCCAMCYASFSLYLGEVCAPRIRGTLISIAAAGSPIGIVVGTIAETYLPMKISSWIYFAQCVLATILFIFLLDSPYYLVKRGNIDGARRAVTFYHSGCEAESELKEIQDFVETDGSQSLKDKLREFKSRVVRKSLILIIILFALPHLSGMMVIASYMEIILATGQSNLIDPKEIVIYANIIAVVSSFLTVKLIDILGRRVLLIVSGVGTSIALISLGIYFYLLRDGVEVESIVWLPIASILMYLITYAVGFGPVPSTVLSEIFPHHIKSVAACVAGLGASLTSFVLSKAFQPLIDAVGEAYVFWIHAGLAFLSVPCALFLLPETKGKTFQEIQNDLVGR